MVARSEKYQNKESDDDDEAEYEEMDEDESDVDDHSLTEAGEAGK